MSLTRRALGVGGLSAIVASGLVTALVVTPAQAAPSAAPVQDFLAEQLSTLSGVTTLMVHGTDIEAARAAVDAAGWLFFVGAWLVILMGFLGLSRWWVSTTPFAWLGR